MFDTVTVPPFWFVMVPELKLLMPVLLPEFDTVMVPPAWFAMVPELLMPVPEPDIVMVPELEMMPKEVLVMPMPELDTVMVPELEIPMVVPELLLFWMPTVPAGFDIVMVPELLMVPVVAALFKMPTLPVFATSMVPPSSISIVPELEMPVPDVFDTTNIMPAGMVSVSPLLIVNAVTVQVSGAVHVPPIASHEL